MKRPHSLYLYIVVVLSCLQSFDYCNFESHFRNTARVICRWWDMRTGRAHYGCLHIGPLTCRENRKMIDWIPVGIGNG